jgi:hypothetical protein
MNQKQENKSREYGIATHLLAGLLDLDTGTEEKINEYIKNYGIVHFFENLEVFDLHLEVSEKLNTLKLILDGIISEKNNTAPYDGGDK